LIRYSVNDFGEGVGIFHLVPSKVHVIGKLRHLTKSPRTKCLKQHFIPNKDFVSHLCGFMVGLAFQSFIMTTFIILLFVVTKMVSIHVVQSFWPHDVFNFIFMDNTIGPHMSTF
jgi:hypothetical protein